MRHIGRAAAGLREIIGVREGVLLTWFCVHVAFSVQPHLVYIYQCPLFSLAPSVVAGDLSHSGGLTELLSRYLAQFYASDWPGSLILTFEAALIGILARVCLNALARRPVRHLHLLPMAMFMLQACRYEQQLTLGPAVLALLAGAALLASLRWASAARLAAYAAAAGGFYYAAAGASGKLNLVLSLGAFALLSALFQARRSRRAPAAAGWAAAYLAVAAGIALAGEKVFLTADAARWSAWHSSPLGWAGGLRVALFLSLPAAGLWVLADPWALVARRRKPAATEESAPAEASRAGRQRWLLQLVPVALLLWAISSLSVTVLAQEKGRRNLTADDCYVHGRWNDLLAAVREIPSTEATLLTSYDADAALFHLGRLPDDMFAYAQRSDRMTLPYIEPGEFRFLYRLSDMWLELGRVNDAEHIAYEALTQFGPNPYVLRLLATIHLVKGELPGARVYLRLLTDDRVHRGWARRALCLAQDDRLAAADPEIARLRRAMLRRDDVGDALVEGLDQDEERLNPESMLRSVLAQDKDNRMAFQFLMGTYLLRNELGSLAHDVGRVEGSRIPRAYEEGLLVYLDEPGARVDLNGRTISRESTERYRQFKQALAAYRAGKVPAEKVAGDFSDTFFFYHTFARGAAQ